ncbi:MAG: hypothetical protein QOF89_147 [Acidobacteriota bacterium]|nr:hypothetical protein [Acidobacteriota bacterium]
MKSKASLIFGVLVLMLSAVGISTANAAAAPPGNASQTAAATPFLSGDSSSPSSFLCNLNRSVTSELPKTEAFPPPSVPATTFPPCGACSDFACQGHSINAVCGNGQPHCYDFGSICSQDGQIQCRCALRVP